MDYCHFVLKREKIDSLFSGKFVVAGLMAPSNIIDHEV